MGHDPACGAGGGGVYWFLRERRAALSRVRLIAIGIAQTAMIAIILFMLWHPAMSVARSSAAAKRDRRSGGRFAQHGAVDPMATARAGCKTRKICSITICCPISAEISGSAIQLRPRRHADRSGQAKNLTAGRQRHADRRQPEAHCGRSQHHAARRRCPADGWRRQHRRRGPGNSGVRCGSCICRFTRSDSAPIILRKISRLWMPTCRRACWPIRG